MTINLKHAKITTSGHFLQLVEMLALCHKELQEITQAHASPFIDWTLLVSVSLSITDEHVSTHFLVGAFRFFFMLKLDFFVPNPFP